jgi:hypothetical protein
VNAAPQFYVLRSPVTRRPPVVHAATCAYVARQEAARPYAGVVKPLVRADLREPLIRRHVCVDTVLDEATA